MHRIDFNLYVSLGCDSNGVSSAAAMPRIEARKKNNAFEVELNMSI